MCISDAATPDTATTFYQNALGKLMLDAGRAAREEEISRLAEIEAVKALEDIRKILDDRTLIDAECFKQIDTIVSVFCQHRLTTDRHIECE